MTSGKRDGQRDETVRETPSSEYAKWLLAVDTSDVWISEMVRSEDRKRNVRTDMRDQGLWDHV